MKKNFIFFLFSIILTSEICIAENEFPLQDLTIEKLSTATTNIGDLVKNKKIILVDFWASWCEPCKMSFPFYNDLFKKYKNEIQIIGISLDEEAQDAENFIKKSQPLFPTFIDAKNKSIKILKIPAIPYLFILNSKLEILDKVRGFDKSEKNKINELLKSQIEQK